MTNPQSPIALPSRALIAISGPDWRGFLQGLLTQDVETLAPGEARFAALLTPQGKVLYDLFVVGREEGCWLDVVAAEREALVQRLTIYRLRAKVEIALDPAPVSAFIGENAPPVVDGLLVRDPRLPAMGWRLYGVSAGGDEADYDAYRLSLGVPGPKDWGVGETYPIEAGFDLLHGIDFKKGCFVGQEITSRMKRRGEIRKRMLPLVFEGAPPAAGREVMAGEDVRAGEVLSGAAGRVLALLRLDRIAGQALAVDGRAVRVDRPHWMGES